MMKENLIQINCGITNVDVNLKNIMHVKIISGILLHGVVKMGNISQVL